MNDKSRAFCSDCIFYRSTVDDETGDNDDCGECRRSPPIMRGLLVSASPLDEGNTFEDGIWPIVSHTDYCGEWRSALQPFR